MLSLTVNIIPKPFLTSTFPLHNPNPNSNQNHNQKQKQHRLISKPISATIIPSSSSSSSSSSPNPFQKQFYQPFRPPPSPLPPKFRSLDTNGRIDVLANRLGLWFEYAYIIPSLTNEGFTPPSIEELTGISGVEQNRLLVAAQVRETLVQADNDPETLSFFDTGGAEILYEIRLLSTSQRSAAARFLVENRFDAKGAQDLARAMKDFPMRRGDRGWGSFDYNLPGDCLAFMYYRQAQEHRNPSEQRTAALNQALGVAASEAARSQIQEDLQGKDGDTKEEAELDGGVRVPVVRMKLGEVAESTTVVVLPVCRAEDRDQVMEAPWESGSKGTFGIIEAEKGWSRWVVLPGWEPVAGLGRGRGGVAVAFADARALPWKVNRWYKEEPILVVADRGRKEVAGNDSFYLVAGDDGGLKLERGTALKEMNVEESLGIVVLVVRPPRDEDDDISAEDWE